MMTDPSAAPHPGAAPNACYRHPGAPAAVSCARCSRAICPDCMVPAPVGFQCPECVRAGAKESPQRAAPWRVASPKGGLSVTVVLIGINVAVFLLGLAGGLADRMVESGGLAWNVTGLTRAGTAVVVDPAVSGGQWWRLLTTMFLHGGLMHLAINMLALYVFGTQMERILGRWWFLALYMASGIVGGAVFLMLSPAAGGPAVGASGAIFGLFGAMIALIIPRRHTDAGRAMFQQMIGLLVVNLLFTFAVPGIAWQAHVGGLVAGFGIAWVMDRSQTAAARFAPVAACLLYAVFVVSQGPFVT